VPNHPGKSFLAMKADQMKSINGTTDNMGQRSQGDQELDQRTFQNMQSGNQQKVAFLNNFIDRMFGSDTRKDMTLEDGTKVKINEDLKKRLDNDPRLMEIFLKTGEIPGVGKAKEVQEKEKKKEEETLYNIDGGVMNPNDPTTYPSGLGTGP
tara:strand:+ start:322 stop:777 length:456 start_codon:yes stop_codon:yes gene_type:complete